MDREGDVGYCWGIGVWFTCVFRTEKGVWVVAGIQVLWYTCVSWTEKVGGSYCWGIGVWFTCVTDREGGCGLLLGYRCVVHLCYGQRRWVWVIAGV